MTEEKKVNYINGAVTGMEKKGEVFEITLFDHQATYFCKQGLGMKVGSGYKFGIIDTDVKNRYEIVSVEQQVIKEPAFQIKGPEQTRVQMSLDDYKELVGGKHLKMRDSCLNAAIKICSYTSTPENVDAFKREVLRIAKDLEPYFE